MDTETTCHCGADYQGSDHCPACGCEQYEGGCDHRAAALSPHAGPQPLEAEVLSTLSRTSTPQPARVWSRASKNARWHLSIFTVELPTAAALQAALPVEKDLVRWWLVEDDRYGHLYEFKLDGGVVTALNWPATKPEWGEP